jgi:hypothetical protein
LPLKSRRSNFAAPGLRDHKRGWIALDEYNYDIVERSFHFDPAQKSRGRLGEKFMREVRSAVRTMFEQKTGRIDRTR